MADATPVGAETDSVAAFQNFYDSGAFSTDGKTIPDDADRRPETTKPEGDGAQPEQKPVETEAKPEETEAKPDGEQAEERPQSWESLDQFLTENKLNPDEFKSIPVTVKIDGETRNIPLSDVIKSFQLEGHVNNKSMELSNQRRAFEQEQQQVRQVLKQQIDRNEALGNLAVNQLNAEFQKIDWNNLRATDPAQYAALMTDFQTRNGQLQQYMQNIQAQKAEEGQRTQAELEAKIPKEKELVLEARPEWRDRATYTKDYEQIVAYAKNSGFTDAELGSIYDHRYLLTLHDAARYRALQAAKPAATKLVREAPKMAKPGTRTNRDPQQAARQNALERLNRNPSDIDSQAAYFETLT